MVANERNVNTLGLASLKDGHTLRNLIVVTVNLNGNKVSLSSYSLPNQFDYYQQRRNEVQKQTKQIWKKQSLIKS